MPRVSRCVFFTLVCALLASVAYAGQHPVDADSKEIAAYRLTTAGLVKVIAVTRALVLQMVQDPRLKEAMTLAAEIEALEKTDALTEADNKRLEELRTRQEALEDSTDNPLGGDAKSLSEMEERIRKYPPLVQALQNEAMPPREYAKFWLTFVQAAFAHGFKKSGLLKELPADVNAENVTFMEEHAAEIEAMKKEFEALGTKK